MNKQELSTKGGEILYGLSVNFLRITCHEVI
jgi:hypothetical protein